MLQIAITAVARAGRAAPPRILIVDDEQDIRETLQELLEDRLHAQVHAAASGREGLEILHKVEGFDLIVTDFRMPGMNGIKFLAEAEKVAPGVPHIMVTAFELSDYDVQPPSVVLQKPFGDGEFLGLVESALEGSA